MLTKCHFFECFENIKFSKSLWCIYNKNCSKIYDFFKIAFLTILKMHKYCIIIHSMHKF